MVAMEAALAVLLACSVAGGDGNMVEENNFDGDWIYQPAPSADYTEDLEQLCETAPMQRAASSRPDQAPAANPPRDPRCDHYQATRLPADQGAYTDEGSQPSTEQGYQGNQENYPDPYQGNIPSYQNVHDQLRADRQDRREDSRPRPYGARPHYRREDSYQSEDRARLGARPAPIPRPHFLYGAPAALRHHHGAPARPLGQGGRAGRGGLQGPQASSPTTRTPLTGEDVCERRNPDRQDQQLCSYLPCCHFNLNPSDPGVGLCWSDVGAGPCIPPAPSPTPTASPSTSPSGLSIGWLPPPPRCPQSCDLTGWPLCQCLAPATYSDEGKGNCNVGAMQTDLQVWCYLDHSLGNPLTVCPDARPSKTKPGYYWSRFACITETL